MTDSLMRMPGGPIQVIPASEHMSRLSAGWIYLGPAPIQEKKNDGKAKSARQPAR